MAIDHRHWADIMKEAAERQHMLDLESKRKQNEHLRYQALKDQYEREAKAVRAQDDNYRAMAERAQKTATANAARTNKLLEAIRRDLLAIRRSCTCECGELPGPDCPKMVMAETLHALVQITLEGL